MVFDLRMYGFTDCVIAEDLSDLSNNILKWNKINRVSQKLNSKLTKIEHFINPLFDISGNKYLPTYVWHKKIDEGTYGKIFSAKRQIYHPFDISGSTLYKAGDENYDIVIKESMIVLSTDELNAPLILRKKIMEEEINSHIYEATVLTLAYNVLKNVGLEQAVPRVFEIFCHTKNSGALISDVLSICISMEYISGSTLLSFLNKNFLKSPSSESERDRNNKLFIHIVKEFATIIGVLQTNLRMNHRDIKINNVLIRDKDNPFPTLVLIDYGFACIANGPQDPLSEMSKIEAGSFFGSKYACFKNGRDFAQFLYSLHCHFPLYNYLTGNVLHIVEQWMMIPWEKGIANLMNGLNSVGRPSDIRLNNLIFDEGIYIFLRKPEVDPNHCSPILVLEKIKELCETE